jgi:hypothetical protein
MNVAFRSIWNAFNAGLFLAGRITFNHEVGDCVGLGLQELDNLRRQQGCADRHIHQ